MASSDRISFKADFLRMVDSAGAWPQGQQFVTWCRKDERKIRNAAYRKIRNGELVDMSCILGLLAYLRAPNGKHTDDFEIRARAKMTACINNYLVATGVPDPDKLAASQKIEHLCNDAGEAERSVDPKANLFTEGIGGLRWIFEAARPPMEYFYPSSEKAICEAVTWCFYDLGHLKAAGPLSADEAISNTEQRFQMSLSEYQDYAVTCWRRNPWTVVLARGQDNKATGISIILPLRESVYEQIRSGKLMSCRADPQFFAVPSRYMFHEAVSARPLSMGGDPINKATASMVWTVMVQLAALTISETVFDNDQPFRALSVDGMPDAREMLMAYGYKPIGMRMATSGEDLYELIIPANATDLGLFFNVTLNGLYREMRKWSPP